LRTPEISIAAARQDGDALDYVPETLKVKVKKAASL